MASEDPILKFLTPEFIDKLTEEQLERLIKFLQFEQAMKKKNRTGYTVAPAKGEYYQHLQKVFDDLHENMVLLLQQATGPESVEKALSIILAQMLKHPIH